VKVRDRRRPPCGRREGQPQVEAQPERRAWVGAAGRLAGRFIEPRQFAVYLAVGLLGTTSQFLVLAALVHGPHLDPVLASSCGFVVGAVVNYVANYYITFRSRRDHGRTMARFFLIALAGLGVNAGVMALLSRGIGLHYLVSQVGATGTVVVLTYLGNRFWTFREVDHG
jgi:putative flippase GtrA